MKLSSFEMPAAASKSPSAALFGWAANWLRNVERAWWLTFGVAALLALIDRAQFAESAAFVGRAVLSTGGFALVSVALAAWAKASDADRLIARAFSGPVAWAVVGGALIGALSPFCSCGVIPVVLALLGMGVPAAAVMAFWLSSPLMDPSMFVMTSATLGFEFAVAKTLAAVSIGLIGGFGTLALARIGWLGEPLREGVGNGGCAGAKVRNAGPVVWAIWTDATRLQTAWSSARSNALMLTKWLVLAFVLESLMLAYLPNNWVGQVASGSGPGAVVLATLVGIPSYLNGYAALPLVKGLMAQGFAPGAAMAFLIGGGVTSIPAALAVFGVARRPLFTAYIAFGALGAVLSGLAFGLWLA